MMDRGKSPSSYSRSPLPSSSSSSLTSFHSPSVHEPPVRKVLFVDDVEGGRGGGEGRRVSQLDLDFENEIEDAFADESPRPLYDNDGFDGGVVGGDIGGEKSMERLGGNMGKSMEKSMARNSMRNLGRRKMSMMMEGDIMRMKEWRESMGMLKMLDLV